MGKDVTCLEGCGFFLDRSGVVFLTFAFRCVRLVSGFVGFFWYTLFGILGPLREGGILIPHRPQSHRRRSRSRYWSMLS